MKLNIGSVSGKRVSALVIILNGAEVNISTEFGAKINVGCRSPHLGPKFLVPNPRLLCNLLWAIDIAFSIICHIITFSDGQTTLKLNCLSWIFTTFVANTFFNVVPRQFFAVPNAF